MTKLAFKFISGKYKGGEFPLPNDGELLIGRAADLDMVLVEDMVSRRHARVVGAGGRLTITDLDSTNGTFVNGEKIKQVAIKRDDRVLIGTSILKVVAAGQGEDSDRDALKAMMDNLGQRAAAPSSTMSGDLAEVPLPDLLQLFSTNKKTGSLTVGEDQSKLYLREGALQHVVLSGEPKMTPQKALCRMVTWTHGPFLFEGSTQAPEVPVSFSMSTENVLIEALRQNDEAQRVLTQFTDLDQDVHLALPLENNLTDLSKSELETLQLALNYQKLRYVVDRAQMSDLEALTNLLKLIKQGFLAATP